jgi:hypothetical protein
VINTFNKKKVLAFTLMFTVLILSAAAVADGYETIVTDITIAPSGLFSTTDSLGITYGITGTPGSSGTVTATVASGNPQVTADVPAGVSLVKFITISFNYPSSDFTQAVLTFSYSDSDVAAIQAPYDVYKYNPTTDSYTKLNGIFDPVAETITITLNSTNDPLFAIGGATAETDAPNDYTLWIVIAVAIIIIVLVTVFVLSKRYRIVYVH